MSWRRVTLWETTCDGCGAEHIAADSSHPEGWSCHDDGPDLCPECAA